MYSTSDWFSEAIGKKFGDSLVISFGFETWIGTLPLGCSMEERVFQVSEESNIKMGEMAPMWMRSGMSWVSSKVIVFSWQLL
jgi:hypothetical protein